MAPVIWGLDLKEIQWSKFKNSNMWNNTYHLRRTKFIVYQIAMICCVCSESLGTAALSKYVDKQEFVEKQSGHVASLANDDFIGIASYNIFNGIYVATIFGSGFFFDLFWPERKESPSVRLAWKICSVLACVTSCAAAFGMTVITATHTATVSGVPVQEQARLLQEAGGPALAYRNNPNAIASVVFIWPGFLATIASTVIMFKSLAHDDLYGPWSLAGRAGESSFAASSKVEASPAAVETQQVEAGQPITQPQPVAEKPANTSSWT